MADYDSRLKDYVQVNERIIKFYEKFPDGSLQSEMVKFDVDEHGEGIVIFKAYAYRSPNDLVPGVGFSSMMIPGTTPYTRGSEVENTETSAWGRALAALGFEVKRGIASQNEVDNKQTAEPKSGGCPQCGVVGSIIKGKPQFGGGWLCYKKKGGCGAKFATDPALESTETPPVAPQTAQGDLATVQQRKALWKAIKARFKKPELTEEDVDHLAKSWLEIQLTELDCTRDTMTRDQLEMLVKRIATWEPIPINEPMADADVDW